MLVQHFLVVEDLTADGADDDEVAAAAAAATVVVVVESPVGHGEAVFGGGRVVRTRDGAGCVHV